MFRDEGDAREEGRGLSASDARGLMRGSRPGELTLPEAFDAGQLLDTVKPGALLPA
jgi:hypothetical protein